MVIAGATANTTEGNSRASRESGVLCSHSHEESIASFLGEALRIAEMAFAQADALATAHAAAEAAAQNAAQLPRLAFTRYCYT